LSNLYRTGKDLLRRVEVLVLLAATCAMLIPATRYAVDNSSLGGPIEWLAVGVILLSMYLACRSVRLYVTRDRLRLVAAARDAHLQGASLVTDTLRDRVGNKLAVTAGYSEMLLEDPRLPQDVREQAERIFDSSMSAARTMQAVDPSHFDLDANVDPPQTTLAGRAPIPRRTADPSQWTYHDAR
jgi:hypothetical protein